MKYLVMILVLFTSCTSPRVSQQIPSNNSVNTTPIVQNPGVQYPVISNGGNGGNNSSPIVVFQPPQEDERLWTEETLRLLIAEISTLVSLFIVGQNSGTQYIGVNEQGGNTGIKGKQEGRE